MKNIAYVAKVKEANVDEIKNRYYRGGHNNNYLRTTISTRVDIIIKK